MGSSAVVPNWLLGEQILAYTSTKLEILVTDIAASGSD